MFLRALVRGQGLGHGVMGSMGTGKLWRAGSTAVTGPYTAGAAEGCASPVPALGPSFHPES